MTTRYGDARPSPYCRALGWLGSGPSRSPLFPAMVWRYLAYTGLLLVVGLGLTEGTLRYLADQDLVVSAEWLIENERINRMSQQKVLSTASDPIWRSAGIPLAPRLEAARRILVLGDSFVWGDGYLNANDIWWRQLQRELRHRGYFDIEVIAAGLNGAATQDQLRWLAETDLLARAAPDLIIIGYVTNDPDTRREDGRHRVPQIGRDVPIPEWPLLEATLGRVAPTLSAQVRPQLVAKWSSRVTGAYAYSDWELEILKSPNRGAYAEVLRSLGTLLRERGSPVFVVTLPNHPSREAFGPRYAAVKPLFAEAGLPFYDLLEAFVQRHGSNREDRDPGVLRWGINPANGHPGPVATRFHARAVADILERHYRETLGRRREEPSPLKPVINDWMPPATRVRQVGPGQWDLRYPAPGELAPHMPIGAPHVVLAFELPVAIRQIRLSGEQLEAARLWVTTADPRDGVDRDEWLDGSLREGDQLVWTPPGSFGAAINTLRVAASLQAAPPERVFELRNERIFHRGGHAFAFPVPQLVDEADHADRPARSTWVLLEDGAVLEPSHAEHAGIEAHGRGRWSHWRDAVIFSATDNSDPRRNGRRYQLVKYAPESSRLRLAIDFDEVAVRP